MAFPQSSIGEARSEWVRSRSADRREALLSVAQVKTSEHLVMDALRVPGLDPELTYRVEVPPLSLLRSMPFGPAVAQPEWITAIGRSGA